MVLVKDFGRIEAKMFGFSVLGACFLVSMMCLAVLKPYIGSSIIASSQISLPPASAMIVAENSTFLQKHPERVVTPIEGSEETKLEDSTQKIKPMCNVSDERVDVCELDGDVRILGNSSSIVLVTSSQLGASIMNESWRIRPYARKGDPLAMGRVKELSLKSSLDQEETPPCNVNHSVPAIIFSMGGYFGNLFHAFAEVFVSLFLTSYEYSGEVQFLITDMDSLWTNKYKLILQHLSHYEIIDYDKNDRVHCFPHAIVGLRFHKELSIDPSKSSNGYSMVDFTKFLRRSYSLEKDMPIRIGEHSDNKPRLLIIARKFTRTFMNVEEIVQTAQEMGFEVVVEEADVKTDFARFAQVVNSCDVMMGVHGAGLTNSVFLPTNAILIQVVPLRLEWAATRSFGEPAIDMKLRYLEYKIKEEESTLIEQYPRDHIIFTDPVTFDKQGWQAFSDVFLVKQNVKLDVKRFRPVLSEAIELLHQ